MIITVGLLPRYIVYIVMPNYAFIDNFEILRQFTPRDHQKSFSFPSRHGNDISTHSNSQARLLTPRYINFVSSQHGDNSSSHSKQGSHRYINVISSQHGDDNRSHNYSPTRPASHRYFDMMSSYHSNDSSTHNKRASPRSPRSSTGANDFGITLQSIILNQQSKPQSYVRSASFEWLSNDHNSSTSLTPCMLKLPFTSQSKLSFDISTLLSTIKADDWSVPYVVSCIQDQGMYVHRRIPSPIILYVIIN